MQSAGQTLQPQADGGRRCRRATRQRQQQRGCPPMRSGQSQTTGGGQLRCLEKADRERQAAGAQAFLERPERVGLAGCLDRNHHFRRQAESREPAAMQVSVLGHESRCRTPEHGTGDLRRDIRSIRSKPASSETHCEGERCRPIAVVAGFQLDERGRIEASSGQMRVERGLTQGPSAISWGRRGQSRMLWMRRIERLARPSLRLTRGGMIGTSASHREKVARVWRRAGGRCRLRAVRAVRA